MSDYIECVIMAFIVVLSSTLPVDLVLRFFY